LGQAFIWATLFLEFHHEFMHYHIQLERKKALCTFSANLVIKGLTVEFAKIIFNVLVQHYCHQAVPEL
jgi:hypothetical protein